MTGRDLPIDEIVTRLIERTEELARVLLPAGVKDGHEWRAGSVNGEPGQSLGVHLYGAKRGLWADFNSADDRGDMLDLIAATQQLSKGEAVAWAKGWLGLDDAPGTTPVARPRSPSPASPEKPTEPDFDMVAWARGKWQAARPIEGTLGEVYFRERGIVDELPPTLRFAPSLLHKRTGLYLPAIIVAIQEPDSQVSAIHRLYLSQDGRKKAPISRPKVMGGQVRGGACRLAPAAKRLGLAEGVENGLSAKALYDLPIWCVLAASNFGAVELPSVVETVVMFVDGDAPGSKAHKGVAKQALTLMRRGLKVEVARPPVGQDFNDILRGSVEPPVLKEAAHV